MNEKRRPDHSDEDRKPSEAADRADAALDDDGDFADEHGSTTYADEMDGGPEGIPEPESPKGRGGDGGMD